MELIRQKNVATRIVFPLVDADGDFVTGATSPDSEIDQWTDGANPSGFADCTNEATEIGATGVYYLNLTQTEMNEDYIVVQVKSGTAKTQCILIQTMVGAPTARATTTVAGRPLDVSTGGEVGLDWANIGSPTTAQNLSATNIDVDQAVNSVTSAVTVGAINSAVITAASIADGAIDRATFAADTGLQTIRSNTAAAGAAGTITLDASASAIDDFYNCCFVYITGSTGVGQVRLITDYVGSTQVATVSPNWATNPSGTSTFAILPVNRVCLGTWLESIPSVLLSGRVDSSTGAMATDVMTGTALAASAVSEIQSGLSTLDAAGVRTAVGLGAANLDTQLTAIDDFLDTEVAAIKAKTDNLPATPAATGDAMTLTSGERTTTADVILARSLATESYAADGTVPTLSQALLMQWAFLVEKAIAGTTITVKKLDGVTTAMTFTIDHAVTPTSITRAT